MSSFEETKSSKNEETDKGNSEIALSNIALDLESNNYLKRGKTKNKKIEDKTSENYSLAFETGNADKKEDTDQSWETQSATTPLINPRSPHSHRNSLSPNLENATANVTVLADHRFRTIPVTSSSSDHVVLTQICVCSILSILVVLILSLIIYFFYPSFVTQTTTTEEIFPWSNIRLPNTLTPYHYDIDLQPILTPSVPPDYYTFNGDSTVYFTVKNATSYIIIHSKKLNYSEVSVADESRNEIMSTYMLYEKNQFLVVTLTDNLIEGHNYSLKTLFHGELAEDLGGLYRSSYENEDQEQVIIATTQMEPTDARKAFPCFDEPAFKATFNISLWHMPPNFAISNMPNISIKTIGDGWLKTSFEKTLKMSTYLLAFVVCDFGYVESRTNDSVQTRIYARPRQIENGNGDYAKNITPTILDFYENYFQVQYPLPKSDQIAVPDFAAGAMENWGLVIYRETALLYDPEINSASNQQRVAVVVAHELAHQWFGNLISPTWWDELWLNEGFASYIEYIGTNWVEPTWGMNEQFIIGDLQRAMRVDSLTSSRPIIQEVSTPSEINALFDTISYSKGACIIRMINEFAGDDAFKRGLTKYLEDNKYGSVNHIQLFQAWSEAINDTQNPPSGFSNAMDTWILQMGFPVVNMNRVGNTNQVMISQERFLIDPEANKSLPASPYDYKWDIPLWYVSERNNTIRREWMLKEDTNVSGQLTIPADEYFIGNYGAFGYYRVNYDEENWDRISTQLQNDFSAIEVKTRGQLIDDAFNLARSGLLSYEIALGLTEFLISDFQYVPWETALNAMSYFDLVLGRSKVYGPYSEYLLYLSDPLYANVTWTDGGSHLEQYQRINALSVACDYGKSDCVNQAQSQFATWMNESSDNSISPNLRTIVYCNGIRYGGVKEWDFALEQYINETDSQEKAKIESGLTCTRTPWIIKRFLEQYILNSSFVRAQDASTVIRRLCSNDYARDITWDYLRSEWKTLYKIYGTGFFSFSGIINSCTSHFSTAFELQELERFKEENADSLGSALRTTEQAIEITKTNIAWRENYEITVFNWLTNKLLTL